MALPLPKVVYDVEKGGPVLTSMEGGNAFTKGALENKYKPLQMAINAQNALSYSSRMGQLGSYFKAISMMPAAEREKYLADPENRKNYMNMTEQFRQGMQNPQQQGQNVLSPDYVQSFFGGQNEGNPLSSLFGMLINKISPSRNALTSPPPSMGQNQGGYQEQNTGTGDSSGYSYDTQGNNVVASPEEVSQAANRGEASLNQSPTGEVNLGGGVTGQVVPEVGTGVTPQQQEVSSTLSPQERATLSAQVLVNNKTIGTALKNRADSSIAFDKFLHDARPEIQKVITDAARYSGVYGRGKNWLDKLRANQPEEYANYIHAKAGLVPLVSNGLRMLEGMGVSHEAQEDAKAQVFGALDKLEVSPETAIKVFNKHMKLLQNVSNGVLTSAEQAYPGVRRKLAGLKEIKGDFIPENIFSKNQSKIPSGRIEVISPNGKHGHISASNWEEAKKEGYKRV